MTRIAAATVFALLCGCGGQWKTVRVFRDYKQIEDLDCAPVLIQEQIIAPPKKAMKIAYNRGANAIHIQRDIGDEVVADPYICP